MSISTYSIFYYGFDVDSENNKINFDEGSGELTATLNTGSYTLTSILAEIERAMESAGNLDYTVTVDRVSRKITISAGSNFDLLVSSGSNLGFSVWSTIGFTGGSDLTGASSYTGSSGAGNTYEPQYILQDYIDKNQNLKVKDSKVNESASGEVESLGFGEISFIEMNIMFITDESDTGPWHKENASGKSDAEAFLTHCIRKRPVEFMPDINTRGSFEKLLLESSAGSNNGTSFRLKEFTDRGLPGFYETGKLVFRVIN